MAQCASDGVIMPITSVRFLLGFVGALVLFGVALTVLGHRGRTMEPVQVHMSGPVVPNTTPAALRASRDLRDR
jgi:hypothetical protein